MPYCVFYTLEGKSNLTASQTPKQCLERARKVASQGGTLHHFVKYNERTPKLPILGNSFTEEEVVEFFEQTHREKTKIITKIKKQQKVVDLTTELSPIDYKKVEEEGKKFRATLKKKGIVLPI